MRDANIGDAIIAEVRTAIRCRAAVWLVVGMIGGMVGCSTGDGCGVRCADDCGAPAAPESAAAAESVNVETAPDGGVAATAGVPVQVAAVGAGGVEGAEEPQAAEEEVDERPPNPMRELKAVSRIERKGGLVIEELQAGAGAPCWPGGVVIVRYEGRLTDGTVFDNNFEAEQPNEFSLKTVLEGWKQGVPGMRVGGKRRLTIPPALGYGEDGVQVRPGVYRIPPDATLIFDIELIGVRQQMKVETERSSVEETGAVKGG